MALALLLVALQQGPLEHSLYRAQMAAAESAMRLGELAVARAWLDETAPARRGFEWRVHDAELDESLARFDTGAAHASAIACSPDGTLLACGLSSGAVELRAAQGGELLATLGTHAEGVTYARFDPTGERLVTASYDRTVKVWDLVARQLALDYPGHGFPVGGAAFSPDGRWVASCAYERPPGEVVGTVHLWNALDGTLVRALHGGRKPLVGLEFSPDGRRLAAGSWDFCVFVWDVAGGEPIQCAVPDEGLYNAVDGVAWSPDGRLVAGASKDRTARVWNAADGALVASLRGHTDAVTRLAFSPDGATLATAARDGSLRLWNTAGWSLRATLRGHADDVLDLAFEPAGGQLYSASLDRSVCLWDAGTSWYGGAGMRADQAVYVTRFSPDDRHIASSSFDGRIQLWDADTLELEASWQAHPQDQSCHALAWTADGRSLVSGSWEPVVRLWDVETRSQRAAFEQGAGTYWLVTSPTDPLAATCSDLRVNVWDLHGHTRLSEFSGHTRSVLSAHFSPDGRRIVSCGRDGQAIVWEAASGVVDFRIAAADGGDLAEAQFTPDGRELVVAGRAGVVSVHSASDGKRLRELVRHRHGIDHIALSPDGSRVALAADTVVLLDRQLGGIVGQLRPHRAAPYHVAFDAQGLRLVSGSTDGSLAVSDTRPLRERLGAAAAAAGER